MRRVLIISHTYVEPANRGKLRALAARGLEVTVGVPQRWTQPVGGGGGEEGGGGGRASLHPPVETTWERQHGVEVFPIPTRGGGGATRFGQRALVALLRDKRPDLIQVEEEPVSPAAQQVVRLARRLKTPVVLYTWENQARRYSLLTRWRRRRTLRRLRGVAAGSEAAAALVRRDVPNLPIAVVPQLGVHVPTTAEHRLHEGLILGYVGRLVVGKGVDTLLEALAEIRSLRWQLTLVGDGPDRERFERQASELRLAARIRWLGALPALQMAAVWPDLDVLVLPSRAATSWTEASAHVLAEAMAREIAVVGSDTGVLPEVIGDAGVVVPTGDAGALAAALRRLADEAVRRPLAQAARARAMRHYSDDAVAEKTLEFWRSLVEP